MNGDELRQDLPTNHLTTELLVIATENAELRIQLAEAQNQCVALAVDAGELQAEVESCEPNWPRSLNSETHGKLRLNVFGGKVVSHQPVSKRSAYT